MMQNSGPGKALIVDDEKPNREVLKTLLSGQGYQVTAAANGVEAVELFDRERPDIVFMDVMMPLMDGYEATRLIKSLSGNRFVPVIFLTALNNEKALARCIEAGGDDFLVKPYDNIILQSKIRSMQRIAALHREVQGMYSMIHREQEIAESVYVNAIQRTNIDNPYLRHVVRPASIFSGDMVLSAYSPARDLFFLTGDFTGHGLPAALGAMPVSEVFRAMTTKGFEPGEILSAINGKLHTLLPTGMFLGAQLIVISHDLGHVRAFNAGMPDLLIIDGSSHRIRHRFASTGLPLGVDASIDTRELLQYAPISHNDKILMYSDGLVEARNAGDQAFGDARLLDAIETAPLNRVFDHVLDQLDAHCGRRTQADDVTLVEIACVHDVLPRVESAATIQPVVTGTGGRGEWKLSLRCDAIRLRETNPVPVLVNYLQEMEALQDDRQALFTIMTELYVNALDHGLLGLDSAMKRKPGGAKAYYETRESGLASLDSGYVAFELSAQPLSGRRGILLRVEDSGNGFDYERQLASAKSGCGLAMVRELCESLEFEGRGNVAVARFSWNAT